MPDGQIGHNQPPSAIDEVRAEFSDFFLEAENWCDGEKVKNDAQMEAVDQLIADIKRADKAAKDGKEEEFRPHKKAADAVVAAWKPLIDDITRYKSALLATVGDYKKQKAREAEIERQRLADEAAAKEREAQAAQRAVDMADVAQRKEADDLAAEARQMEREAQAAAKAKPTGMRKFWTHEIEDGKAFINWLAVNDKPAVLAFMDEYARKAVREGVRDIPGVKIYQDQRAV